MKQEPEVVYNYVKGSGWVPSHTVTGRSAEQTLGLDWRELRSGDAVYIVSSVGRRVARVHQMGEPIPLEPEDHGAWCHAGTSPLRVNSFGRMGVYPRHDNAWTKLIGISFPGGKDYA